MIVARPLVLGEDPGLTDHLSGAAGIVLALLWLVAAAGWAVWRAWSGEAGWRASAVEGALLAVVILVFVSAIGAASYKHPAWLIASEWFVLLVAFCLVRQLAITPGDNQCLLAVVLATGVSLSLHGIYQYVVELPGQRAEADKPEQLVQTLAQTGVYLDPNDPLLEHWKSRLQADNVFATYVNPNSFAGFLALLFPLGLGWAMVSQRRLRWTWKTGLTWAFAAIMGAALWFTHSRGAILATLVVGALIGGIFWRRILWTHKWKCLAAATSLAVIVYLLLARGWVTTSGMEKAEFSMTKRLDYWAATWQMIQDHPWLGVGPGQFGRFYPRYMRETALEKITNPHNFVLEMWATCGLFALIALGAALIAFFWRTRSAWPARPSEPTNDENEATGPRWEFYLGGMAGLLLAFALWGYDLTGDNLADQLIYGGFKFWIRSLFWFGCFALFESIPWPGPTRAMALTAGFAALLLNLLVSDGISLPSVAQPLWIVAALTLNTLPQAPAASPLLISPQRRREIKRGGGIMAPIPVLGAVCLAYFFFLFDPTVDCGGAMRKAKLRYPHYWEQMDQLSALKDKTNQQLRIKITESLFDITKMLEAAANGDPRQRQKPFRAEPLVELAQWYGEEWQHSTLQGQALINLRNRAARCAEKAIELDPEGLHGYRIKYQLNLTFAKNSLTETKRFYELASEALAALVRRDPTEAANHYQWAEVLFQLGDQDAAKKEAEKALWLDRVSIDPARKLRESQRWQLLADLQPENVSIRYQLTEALYLEGHREQGKREAGKTLELDKQDHDPQDTLTEEQRRNLQDWVRPPSSN